MDLTSRLRRHLTYANVGVTLCLAMAMTTGAAYAASVAANSVGTLQIRNGSITGADLGSGSVRSGHVAPNALTGADINELTLAGVNATTVGRMAVRKVNYQVPVGTRNRVVLNFPGRFTLEAQCQAFDDLLHVEAYSRVENSRIVVRTARVVADDVDSFRDLAGTYDLDFDKNERIDVDAPLPNAYTKAISIHFSTPQGFVADADLEYYYEPAGDEFDPTTTRCKLTGVAIGG